MRIRGSSLIYVRSHGCQETCQSWRRSRREVTNFEFLQQMPLQSFANIEFEEIRLNYNELEDFEVFLRKEIHIP